MRYTDEERCAERGLDAREVEAIARRISNAVRDARRLGLVVFGGSGNGSLRVHDDRIGSQGVVARLEPLGSYDGGDGGDFEGRD